jgi:Xaa-Pro aminopeptidase
MEFWGEGESFTTIVAFWKNSAIPHHKTWNTKIEDWVLLIDMWAL